MKELKKGYIVLWRESEQSPYYIASQNNHNIIYDSKEEAIKDNKGVQIAVSQVDISDNPKAIIFIDN